MPTARIFPGMLLVTIFLDAYLSGLDALMNCSCLGFRVSGLGFRGSGFRSLGLRV